MKKCICEYSKNCRERTCYHKGVHDYYVTCDDSCKTCDDSCDSGKKGCISLAKIRRNKLEKLGEVVFNQEVV